MQISILDRQQNLTPDTHEFAERRLRFALSRFASRIDHVSLVVVDPNGPRGGLDKCCNVTIKIRRLADVRVSSVGENVETSIGRAAEKAGRAVSRAIERYRAFDRRRPHAV